MFGGRIALRQLLRKLAYYPRKNDLAVVRREVGRIERTTEGHHYGSPGLTRSPPSASTGTPYTSCHAVKERRDEGLAATPVFARAYFTAGLGALPAHWRVPMANGTEGNVAFGLVR